MRKQRQGRRRNACPSTAPELPKRHSRTLPNAARLVRDCPPVNPANVADPRPFRLDGPRSARLLCRDRRSSRPEWSRCPPPPGPKSRLTYRDAGVDIDAGNALVEAIGPAGGKDQAKRRCSAASAVSAACSTSRHAASRTPCWSPPPTASAPSSSSPSKPAFTTGIGIDLVAMNVNDIVVQGAEPLFFLDYFAVRQARPRAWPKTVIGSIAKGCKEAGAR